jgi:hypothetical protein
MLNILVSCDPKERIAFIFFGCLCGVRFHRNTYPKAFRTMNLRRLFYSYAYCEQEMLATNCMLEFLILQNFILWPEKHWDVSDLIIIGV